MQKAEMNAREMKIAAARAALDAVESGMTLGLGTGSTAEEVVRRAPCPVLVVKEPRAPDPLPDFEPTGLHPGHLEEGDN